MRKMKKSGVEWIGDIPENWEVSRIKNVAKIITGSTPSKATGAEENFSEDGLLWVKPDNLNGLTPITDTKEKLTQKGRELARIVEPLTPLVCCIGTIGKVGVSKFSVSFNQQINAVCFSEKIEKRFGLYSLIAQEEQHQFFANGNVLKILNTEGHGQVTIAIPDYTEQCNISDYLDKKCTEIDALIDTKEKSNALLKEQRQSIIYEVVTKGLNLNVPMKDSGVEWIGEIPDSWKISRFRSEFSFGKGLPITKADLTEDGIGVVSYGQIHSKANVGTSVKKEMIKFVNEKYMETNISSLACTGDIIFADTSEDLSGCGNCVYVDADEPIFAGYHTIIARPKERENAKYYAYLFATDAWRSQIRAKASGVKLFSITQAMLRDALIILPNETDMSETVTFLDDKCSQIDTLIEANITTIEKLKEYRKSIIFEAVTGKVEI